MSDLLNLRSAAQNTQQNIDTLFKDGNIDRFLNLVKFSERLKFAKISTTSATGVQGSHWV